MSFFNFNKFYTKSKKNLSFSENKHKVSYKAYLLLKKFVVLKIIDQSKLDFAYPQKWKPKIFKNLSPRALKSLYRLSDKYQKNSHGIISQTYGLEISNSNKKKISKKSNELLKKINNNLPRYENIDLKIKKLRINNILD